MSFSGGTVFVFYFLVVALNGHPKERGHFWGSDLSPERPNPMS